jgi:hypothetical protein
MWNNHQVNYKYGESERNRTKAKNAIQARNFILGLLMISILPLMIIIAFIIK